MHKPRARRSEQAHFRRLPVGAEPDSTGTHFRVWAPRRSAVSVCLEGGAELALEREGGGYFSAYAAGAGPGNRYRFRLDKDEAAYPDPASRFQPEGPHGPSEIVDAASFAWKDGDWPGLSLVGQVLYEMHIGTFTPEGTWLSAAKELGRLKDIGITAIEMMPVAEFPGRFGWGYDGVDLFAPTHLYGSPDDLRRFVARAHALGVGVILDVVYNHFGPDGCYLKSFAPDYFTAKHENDWGAAINFDGENAAGVRDFVIANAQYWIEEFHFDGLRLDATQSIHDSSKPHIITCICQVARESAGGRNILMIAENEEQNAVLVRSPAAGGYGMDALWNDDFHHSALVAMTGHNTAYYSDHAGDPQEFISAAKYGYLFQGQFYAWQDHKRGSPALDLNPAQFVLFLENHDQLANSATGLRLHQLTSPGRMRAFTALMLLLPGTPMLFQGQEFQSSKRFLYFADHQGKLAQTVEQGRREFLAQFPNLASPDWKLASPHDPLSFERCKLDWSEFESHFGAVALHRDLLALRRNDPVFRSQKARSIDGAVIGPEAFLLRFFGDEDNDRLLVVNYGRDLNQPSLAEPLFAPPADQSWQIVWSSEDMKYGGSGVAPLETDGGLHIPGHAALVWASRES